MERRAAERWASAAHSGTSPLRNVGVQLTFFHNGAFTRLEEAIAHHLDVRRSTLKYTPMGRLNRA